MWKHPNCHLALLPSPKPAEPQRAAFSLSCARNRGHGGILRGNDHQLRLSACPDTWSLLSAEPAITLLECRAPHLEASIPGGPPLVTKMVGLSPWHTAPVSLWLGPSGLLSVLHPWGGCYFLVGQTQKWWLRTSLCVYPNVYGKTIAAWLCWATQRYQGLQRSQVSLPGPWPHLILAAQTGVKTNSVVALVPPACR